MVGASEEKNSEVTMKNLMVPSHGARCYIQPMFRSITINKLST
jgi:hypothetical protein